MKSFKAAILFSLIVLVPAVVSAQTFKRTTYKSDKLDFGMGGTVTIIGAQHGSITVEGSQNAEIEVTAEIENTATSPANLDVMDAINGFVLDEGFGHVTITTVGVSNKDILKKLGKKVSKEVAASQFRINYRIKVPRYADLNINGGTGDFTLSGVDGTLKINFAKTDAKMFLAGGSLLATFGEGTLDITIPSRGWRGRFADVQLSSGKIALNLPTVFDAEIEASVLRTGSIVNNYEQLKPRPRSSFTEKQVSGKTGNGGVQLKFAIGDGTMTIGEMPKNE